MRIITPMPNARLRALTVAAALLAGCGGGGTSPSLAPTPQRGTGTASVALSIVVPARSGQSRRPNYISPSTQSISVIVNGGPPQNVDTSASNPNCHIASGGTTCTATIAAPIGSDTFLLKAYDAPNGTGNLLSQGTASNVPISAGQNTVNLTLNGVVASIAITATNRILEGTSGTTTATFTAKDADGNTIAGTFDTPVTLSGYASATLNTSSDALTLNYTVPDPPTSLTANGSIAVTGPKISTVADLVSPGALALWYDAARLAAGSAVSTWPDRSPNLKDLTQTNPAAQPTAIASTIGGKTALVFTESTTVITPPGACGYQGQYFARPDGFPATGDYTIFVVAQNTSMVSNPNFPTCVNPPYSAANLLSGGVGAGPGAHALSVEDTAAGGTAPGPAILCLYENLACVGNSSPAQLPIAKTTNPVISGSYRVTAIVTTVGAPAGRINEALSAAGALTGTDSTQSRGTTLPGRMADPSVVVNDFGGTGVNSGNNTIGEIIVLNHAPTGTEQSDIEAYLHAKWGV